MLKFRLSLFTFFLLYSYAWVGAQDHKYSCGPDAIAFDGNDLVSYFDGAVKKGSDKFSYQYDGLNLYFYSNTNLQKFKNDPEKYLPEYNGWCAIALTNGTLAKPDYSQFKLQDGRLLFFEVRAFFNGKTAWDKDPDINKIVADKKFAEIF